MKTLVIAWLTFATTHMHAETPPILQTVRPQHPRLLMSSNDFVRLRNEVATDSTLRAWQQQLVRRANDMLAAPPSRYEIPDGLRLLFTSRRVLDRVTTLALLYRLDGHRRYAERAWQELSAAAKFPDWNPRHFLDTAEMTHAFAIGYDWLYDVWTPEQRRSLREAIVQKGLLPARDCYRGASPHKWWVSSRFNWNQVCNGGIGMGALAVADEEPELAGEILAAARKSLPLAMTEYVPDGAWAEGPGYWHYATAYNVVFLAALDTALGTDFGLSKLPGFDKAGEFPLHITGPLDRTFNYADADDRPIVAPEMFWLARRFQRPDFAAYQLRHAKAEPYDLIWYAPGKSEDRPLDKYFAHAEVVTMRSAWNDPRAIFVGFKAGSNKVGHSQLDLGTFVLDAFGYRWAVDLGRDDYNLPGYFGDRRWTYYRLRAEGHNTLVFNPGERPDQNPDASTTITSFASASNLCVAVADLSAAYGIGRVRRTVALRDRDSVLIQDEIQSSKSADLWWFMHTPAEIVLSDDGKTATLRQGKEILVARVHSPDSAGFVVMDAKPLPTSPQPARQADNAGIRKLAIHLPDTKEVRIAVTFGGAGG